MAKDIPFPNYTSTSLPLPDIDAFKRSALHWAASFDRAVFLDSNNYQDDPYTSHEGLIAAGQSGELLSLEAIGAFDRLRSFHEQHPGWLFGFLSYDLKNDVEQLSSKHPDPVDFPAMHFFRPAYVIELFSDRVHIHSHTGDPHRLYKKIMGMSRTRPENCFLEIPPLQARMSKSDYLDKVQRIRQHIREGDLYEMTLCQEFYSTGALIRPTELFLRFNELSKAPFSSFYRLNDRYLLSASPERFLKKTGNKLISQPIKGTIQRGDNPEEDLHLRQLLYESEKDRAENIMIVDLVRNDLARSCRPGSVQVEELFGVYGFEQVFQMISTVSGELREDVHFVDAIRNAFPMGSMTGAPKVRSMQLIEQYEQSRRGLYSGAVGYITPSGDFDFNVVIRSLLYNAAGGYLSFQVGGAIVYDSQPELEYLECLLKARGMLKILRQEISSIENPSVLRSSQNPG